MAHVGAALHSAGLETVGPSTSHNPMSLHCLVQGWLYYLLYCVENMTRSSHEMIVQFGQNCTKV
jgi:hypothetical protein